MSRIAGHRSGPRPHLVEVTALLRELTARLIRAEDLQHALDVLAGTAVAAVPGVALCGVTVLRDGHPATIATAGTPPVDGAGVDQLQYDTGEGPCLEAIRSRALTASPDLTSERRWTRWTPRARELGVHSVLSVPMDVDEAVVGALNLYGTRPAAMDDQAQLTALLIAEHAGLLLGSVVERGERAELTARLVEDLREGAALDHAIGIVMAQRRCTAAEALAVLRDAAEALDVRPRVVAERLIAAVGGPVPPTGRISGSATG
ncbi:GAF and ANTAR domain-containing protein [Rhizomonospora bruguierae]|uniref:GAF and ANTAR domain-containing protein n=1 Tax=Rhizomonospora bruguierae TaxID=1581705 RepID=UPI001BCB633A|nr:GAF and ANTAR domain-containing protein [Micromonospora sp. NBRC 107566]